MELKSKNFLETMKAAAEDFAVGKTRIQEFCELFENDFGEETIWKLFGTCWSRITTI